MAGLIKRPPGLGFVDVPAVRYEKKCCQTLTLAP
jgi:hypothetical protein